MKKYIPYLFFLILILGLFIANYTPGTWLTGWDNLHPEFDFAMNIKRSIQAAWQEYQSLGLLGGMGHASDLPRQLFLWITSLIVPQHLIRYFYHFLMLFVGTIGIYTLLKNEVLSPFKEDVNIKGAVLGALFYLLNLGTIQYFFVPFEPYSTFWGLFPWEVYTLLLYYKAPTRRNLLFLILANIAAIPQGYVQTIFFVYLICVSVLLGISIVLHRTKDSIFHSIKIILIIICINAFWLLPNLYFVAKDVSVTQNAMQNKMATEKFFQMNKQHGTVADFPLLKEFYYDFLDFNNNNQPDFMMKSWRTHFSIPVVQIIGYLFFVIILFGLLQKNRYRPQFISLFLLSVVIFLSNTFLISNLNDVLRSIPLINQIFRNPFTKFIVPIVFIFSIGFSLGATQFLYYFDQKKLLKSSFIFAPLLLAFFIYTFPVWKGQLIAPQMRVKIPTDYFQTFDYFKHQDKNARIMNLPQGSYWGWEIYKWGVRGSGFLWYGIEQPILDRAFDVWSKKSEGYYWELSYALQKRDQALFNAILEKYQIQFVLYDDSFSPSDNFNSKKVIVKQKDMVENNTKLSLDAQFGSIYIYKTHIKVAPNNNIIQLDNLSKVSQTEKYMTTDQSFTKVGFYYNSSSPDFITPFGSLFTSRFQDEISPKIKVNNTSYSITSPIPAGQYVLDIPSFSQTETNISSNIFVKRQGNQMIVKVEEQQPIIRVDNQVVKIAQLTKEYPISINQDVQFPLFISVNNKDFYKISSLTADFSLIGTSSLLSSKNSNYIHVFTSKNAISELLKVENFQKPNICGVIKGDKEFGYKTANSSLSLTAKNTAICSVYNKTFPVKANSLNLVSYTYTSALDEVPQFCSYSELQKECINNKDTIRTGFSRTEKPVIDTFESISKDEDNIFFNFILEAISDEDKDKLKKISYKDIAISNLPLLASITIDTLGTGDSNNPVGISFLHDSNISVEVPVNTNSSSYLHPISDNIYKKNPLNYDTIMSNNSSIEEHTDSSKFLRTKATKASSSILIRRYDLTAGNGYLIDIKTRNIQNFPFTINVFTNKESRNYLYTYLPKQKEFSSSYYILPPIYQFDQGLNILLSSTSFNSNPTINDLQDISIYQLPYNFITGIHLQKNTNEKFTTFIVPKSKKDSIYKYEIPLNNGTKGFIMLSQGYHDGWKAYVVNNNALESNLPFLFGKGEKDHVQINNWANGWNLQNTQIGDDSKLVIIFWPQYLEYLGFILLIVPLLMLLMNRKKAGMKLKAFNKKGK